MGRFRKATKPRCFVGVVLTLLLAVRTSAQLAFVKPEQGANEHVQVDCATFAQVTKDFLSTRGVKVAKDYSDRDEDWPCGADYRCIQFRGGRLRNAEGKALSRSDYVKTYLTEPSKVDFKWRNLGHGYWAVPDNNFTMSAALQLKKEKDGCSAMLIVSAGLGGLGMLGPLPYELYTWPLPPANGRLQSEYMAAILGMLPK